MRNVLLFILVLSVWGVVGVGCSSDELNTEPQLYDGPLLEADSIRTLYSDSAIVRVMVQAPKRYDYESGDSEFPKGFYMEFFEPDGSISSTLQADYGFYFREEDRYTGIGNIVVESRKENNRLLTDTLHWSPPEEKVYTKAFVTIIEEADTLTGHGLEAAQDFSYYTILKPDGTTLLDGMEEDDELKGTDEDI